MRTGIYPVIEHTMAGFSVFVLLILANDIVNSCMNSDEEDTTSVSISRTQRGQTQPVLSNGVAAKSSSILLRYFLLSRKFVEVIAYCYVFQSSILLF